MPDNDPAAEDAGNAERVLVLAPTGRDAAVVCAALAQADIACTATASLTELAAELTRAAGAALITEEALVHEQIGILGDLLDEQPCWSDIPLIVLMSETGRRIPDPRGAVGRLTQRANVVVMVRPVTTVALVTVTRSAVRARRRQYEVRDLLASEQAARAEAEQANRVKDQFLATVSHELRTPLSAILLWSRLFVGDRLNPGQIPQAFRAILHGAEAQSRLIEDLLDMSRMLAGKMRLHLEDAELAPAALNALEVVMPMADAKRVRLDASIDQAAGRVRADLERVQQVIWNLLGNAVKFTPAGGRVSLGLHREAGHVVISVTDTGQGMKADFLPQVFDRFRQQSAGTTSRHGGLGLGLAITRQLIELHGGSMSAESPGIGRGSRFIARLPLIDPPAQAMTATVGALPHPA